jgi:predicted permease
VLLIACANVVNINLSRLVKRQRELALRAAIGASRRRLVRQLLTESMLLAMLGGILGLVLAWGLLDLIIGFAARFTPRAQEIALDGHVLLFTLALSVLTGLVFGALPAALTSRTLVPGASDGITIGGRKMRHALVTVQVEVSLILLVGAGLMVRSLYRLQQVDGGFQTERVMTMLLDLNWSKYNESEPVRAFHKTLLEQLSRHPGVTTAAIGRTFPLARGELPSEARFRIEGRIGIVEPAPVLDFHAVSSDYLRTIGVSIFEGRDLSPADDADAPAVALVNLAAAKRYWPDESPIGHAIKGSNGVSVSIVGVVGDVRQYGLDSEATPAAYVSIAQFPLRVANLLVRTTIAPERMERELVEAVYAIDPDQAVAEIQTLEQARRESLAPPRLTTTLLSLFAGLALLITAAGVSGVLALTVSQRTNEIGMSMALGASPSGVARGVLLEGLKLVVAGLAIGIVGSVAFSGLLTEHLFQIEPTDPITLVTVSVILLTVAALACWLPARRATSIDPLEALRPE